MEGLPKLPGLDFENQYKSHFRIPRSLNVVRGYRYITPPKTGKGDEPTIAESVAFVKHPDAILYDPVLTYGRVKRSYAKPFQPQFVLYDKKALTFKAFFRQSVPESPLEHYRIRFVNIIYFLEDDSITVMEPEIINSGLLQGRLIRRGKLPKNTRGELYTWKDFNLGMDIELNGIIFHITDCDLYTRDFLTSQGVDINPAEAMPIDPATVNRKIKELIPEEKPKSHDDKLRRFLEFQGKILKFDCVLDETDRYEGKLKHYDMLYFLQDDTVAIKETSENLEGGDRYPMLLRRTKLPKNWKDRPIDFPSIYLETGDDEIQEYYQPKHFHIGKTIYVYGRRFLILDCDKYTRKYFAEVLKDPQCDRLVIKRPEERTSYRCIPDYLGIGTPEDSLANCFVLQPKPPKKDVVKYLLNGGKYLKYACILLSPHPEDAIRKFVLSYSLADDTISIMEPPIENSGMKGGKFLLAQRVPVPGCDRNYPIYYGPSDFHMKAVLTINDHRFKIVGIDSFVYEYMKEHPELFTKEAYDSVRHYLLRTGKLKEELNLAMEKLRKEDEECTCDPEAEKNVTEIEKCLQEMKLYNESVQAKPVIQEPGFTVTRDAKDKTICPYQINPSDVVPEPCPPNQSNWPVEQKDDHKYKNVMDPKKQQKLRFQCTR